MGGQQPKGASGRKSNALTTRKTAAFFSQILFQFNCQLHPIKKRNPLISTGFKKTYIQRNYYREITAGHRTCEVQQTDSWHGITWSSICAHRTAGKSIHDGTFWPNMFSIYYSTRKIKTNGRNKSNNFALTKALLTANSISSCKTAQCIPEWIITSFPLQLIRHIILHQVL